MAKIEDYALLSDLQTAALVGRDGSIDWLCLPHFDSGACFAALLGTPDHGRWLLAAQGQAECSGRRYLPHTLVLETVWTTPTGRCRVLDFMPPRDQVVDLIRVVEGLEGTVSMTTELVLRFDYGQVEPWVRHHPGELTAIAGPDAVRLATDVPLTGRDGRTGGDFEVRAGQQIPLVMTWAPSWQPAESRPDPTDSLQRTIAFWRTWAGHSCGLGTDWGDAVPRSLITLKALTFEPTGGIVAAATTSLPEQIGGARNWDYRFCWLRDAALTLQALMAAGYLDEAVAWRAWLLRAVAGDPADLQIMYSITGERRLTEYQADWLPGYEHSVPVRIGNAAAEQLQLDVWGEVLDALALARTAIGGPDESWDLQVAMMEHLEQAWSQPDNGLWEMRGPRRHFVHSKVMAWVAADRMVRAIADDGLPGPGERWARLRDQIHAEVLSEGMNPAGTHFVQSYGSTEVDAALLLIPWVGFLPYDDPRVVATIEAIQRDLSQDGFLLRYRTGQVDDGLPGDEGVFLACSFWLVTALVGIGRRDEASALFDRLLAMRNDVGLLSEEYDLATGHQLGNTPQAFSHLGLVNAAIALDHGVWPSDRPAPRPW